MTATATAVRRSSTRAGGRRAGLGHAVDVLLDPPVEGDTLRSRLAATPLHTWLFLLGLTASLTSRWSSYIGLPISLDRVLIPVAAFVPSCADAPVIRAFQQEKQPSPVARNAHVAKYGVAVSFGNRLS